MARAVLAADLVLLNDLDVQIEQATDHLARLVPQSPFAPLTSVTGWGPVRVGNYGGAGRPGPVRQCQSDLPNRQPEPDPIRIRR